MSFFLSYARQDDGSEFFPEEWVTKFHHHVQNRLNVISGDVQKIWKDNEDRHGTNLNSEIIRAIRESSFLIALVSPTYLNSKYCTFERLLFIVYRSIEMKNEEEIVGLLSPGIEGSIENLNQFLEKLIEILHSEEPMPSFNKLLSLIVGYIREQGIQSSTLDKVVMVVKIINLDTVYPFEFRDNFKYEFYYSRTDTNYIEYVYESNKKEYCELVNDLSHELYRLLRDAKEDAFIYLNIPSKDLYETRKSLKHELSEFGNILPNKLLPQDSNELRSFIESDLKKSSISIHLVNAEDHKETRTQIEVATEIASEDHMCFVWIQDEETSGFIEGVKQKDYSDHIDVLQCSLEYLKTTIQNYIREQSN